MISELTQYGAVSAKVHGMYGKRLKPEDYAQLMNMTTVEEITHFLRSRPDWSRALSRLEDGLPLTRARLETALRLQYLEDYTKLFAFVGRDDRELMRFPIYRMELAEILSALRRMHARNPLDVLPAVPDFYKAHSHVDFEKLRLASNLEELSASVSGAFLPRPSRSCCAPGRTAANLRPSRFCCRAPTTAACFASCAPTRARAATR